MVLGLTLAGFAVTSFLGIEPLWAALAGALVLGCAQPGAPPQHLVRRLARSVHVPFLVFVLALGVVVQAVMDNGLQDWMGRIVPHGTDLLALLGIAAVAAILANLVNNLPAVLVLLPLVAASRARWRCWRC